MVAASIGRVVRASPFGLPVGLQLFCVREMLAKNFDETLRMVASLGYAEVEAAGFFGHSAGEVKKAMKDAGLRCPSAHTPFPQMTAKLDEILGYGGELGLDYVVCSTPGFKDPTRVQAMTRAQMQAAYTLDDWRWTTERLNEMGEKVKAAGMKLAFHNGVPECRAMADGVVPYELILNGTDPGRVWFELDCASMKIGGGDPVECLKRYAERFVMLHVKDYKSGPPGENGLPEPAEMGQGVFDNRAIFLAATKARIRHCFVEQEGYDMPVVDSLRIDAEYMRKFTI